MIRIQESGREVFKTNRGIEVIKNPDDDDYRRFYYEFRGLWPNAIGEPYSRSTYDKEGNSYLWRSWQAIHSEIEREINARYNTKTDQNRYFD